MRVDQPLLRGAGQDRIDGDLAVVDDKARRELGALARHGGAKRRAAGIAVAVKSAISRPPGFSRRATCSMYSSRRLGSMAQ